MQEPEEKRYNFPLSMWPKIGGRRRTDVTASD